MAAKKFCETFSKGLIDEVRRLGAEKQNGVSLKYMMEFGSVPTDRNLLISAQFLHKELPVRIARRAIELENLPYGLSEKPAVLKVWDWYLESFRDLRTFPDIKDKNDECEFTKTIQRIKVRHNHVVPMMRIGIQQLKEGLDPKIDYEDLDEIQQFLDRFYLSRIGIRMLIEQHVALHRKNPPNVVGCIDTKLSPVKVAQAASEEARGICMRQYGSAPDVTFEGDPNLTFPYVESHLKLMVFELVKNSLRAVHEQFMNLDEVSPPIEITVAGGLEDVTIRVSDKGGGIPRSDLPRIFTYLYSTAENPPTEGVDFNTNIVPLAGYGFGLPISRVYARYFGGDLQIYSMDGHGTVAYLHLSRLGDSQEPLP
ncbi:[Pyruvate dehydrogenase (acetyl-transferring)] kinase [Bertholletia excelsa]